MTTGNDSSKTPYEHPWKGAPDGLAANVALADLINNLPRRLTVDGRLHPESLLAASGAIAGFAAQRALMEGMSAEDIVGPSSGIEIVQTTNGGLFFYGEPLDQALLPLTPTDMHKLWPLAASGAIDAGLTGDLPPIAPMFEYVARTLGSDREGTPSITSRQLQTPVFDLLKDVWPFAVLCFTGQISGLGQNPPLIVSRRWWPVIGAIAANRMIRDTASAVPPREGLTIVMEAAIYASKLAPVAVEGTAVSA